MIEERKKFLIDSDLFLKNSNKAVNNLWKNFFHFIIERNNYFQSIFIHNLGSFDGYFLYKALLNYCENPEQVNSIIDDKNKFIFIELQGIYKEHKFKIIWKNSYRIFPVSLDKLCKSLKIDGKFSKYNLKYNNIDLFKDKYLLEEFKLYSLQDSIYLFKAVYKLQ